MDMDDELVMAVASELARRRKERWTRRLKLLGQVVFVLAAIAAIVSALHSFGVI
jgi:hypothetical protein